MDNSMIFYVGFFCFTLTLIAAVLTVLEFKNIELKVEEKNSQ
jgi:hypothetical protein